MKRGPSQPPLYYQAAQEIESLIHRNKLQPGDLIPSERELEQIYNISRITVRNAINLLVQKNVIEKVHGKGTYVKDRSIEQKLKDIFSFSQQVARQGILTNSRVVELSLIFPPLNVADKLNLESDEQVIFIKRIRCREDEPIMVDKGYFTRELFDFMLDPAYDFSKQSLYEVIQAKGIRLESAEESLQACRLTDEEMFELETKEDYGLINKRLTFIKGDPISYSVQVSKGNSLKFTIELE